MSLPVCSAWGRVRARLSQSRAVQVAYMEALKAKGLEIYAAYGNTATDIRAYAAAGIPKVTPNSLLIL